MFEDGNELTAYCMLREADMSFSYGLIDVSRSSARRLIMGHLVPIERSGQRLMKEVRFYMLKA